MFGQLGIEWNLLDGSTIASRDLAEIIAIHKRARACCTTATSCASTIPIAHVMVHGVLAADRGRGLVAYAQLTTAQALAPAAVRVPELTADTRDRITMICDGGPMARSLTKPTTSGPDDVVLTGRQLAAHGVPHLPVVPPESVVLLGLDALP